MHTCMHMYRHTLLICGFSNITLFIFSGVWTQCALLVLAEWSAILLGEGCSNAVSSRAHDGGCSCSNPLEQTCLLLTVIFITVCFLLFLFSQVLSELSLFHLMSQNQSYLHKIYNLKRSLSLVERKRLK